MIWRRKDRKQITLTAVAVLCLAAVATAQDAQVDTQISQDLQVMSALVDETVGDFYKKLGSASCMNCHTGASNFNSLNLGDGWHGGMAEGQFVHGTLSDWHFGTTPEAAEATYLDGVGVVIQLSAPAFPDAGAVKIEADIVEGTPTRWEKMRQKLEGGSQSSLVTGMTIDLRAVHLSRDDLVEQLVSLLAESAHNFRNLDMGDRVAISVTFESSRTTRQNWTDLSLGGNFGDEGSATEGQADGGGENAGSVPMLGDVPLIGTLFTQGKKPLPERLTVIANKTDIDAVHAGNMTAEQFADAVEVRVIKPSAGQTVED